MSKHQITLIVGNGFDISVLSKYGKGITTSYESFYRFFNYRYPNRSMNSLIEQMKEAKDRGKNNWSDFEEILSDELNRIKPSENDKLYNLKRDLGEIQRSFSEFLNDVIDDEVINSVSRITETPLVDNYPIRSFSSFHKDLTESQFKSMTFHNTISNGDQLKYSIINLNYTSLLDIYSYLDKDVFDPEPHITSYNNLAFFTNPNEFSGHAGYTDPYIRLLPIDVFHPHGYQDIPRSLLFGTETDYNSQHSLKRPFLKSFWAQNSERYGDLIDNTRLFIIFGCSIGKSDSWWWKRLFQRISASDAELIIYNYGEGVSDIVKQKFVDNSGMGEIDEETINSVVAKIQVVNFGPTAGKEVVFLDLPDV